MASISHSTAGFSYYAGYFNTLPSGDVDLTKKSAYSNFSVRTVYKKYIYGAPVSGDKKVSKQAILKSSGAVVEVAAIPYLNTFLRSKLSVTS